MQVGHRQDVNLQLFVTADGNKSSISHEVDNHLEKGVLLREPALIQQSVIDKRNAIPALSHIRIEASGKRVVRLAGTDLDQKLQCETEGQVQRRACARFLLLRFLLCNDPPYPGVR